MLPAALSREINARRDRLPLEMWREIFAHLANKRGDLLAVTSVSHSWRTRAISDSSLWSCFCLMDGRTCAYSGCTGGCAIRLPSEEPVGEYDPMDHDTHLASFTSANNYRDHCQAESEYALLNMFVERSGVQPFRLTIKIVHDISPVMMATLERILSDEHISSRIFELNLTFFWTYPGLASQVLQMVINASSLERLFVTWADTSLWRSHVYIPEDERHVVPVDALWLMAPKLRRMTLDKSMRWFGNGDTQFEQLTELECVFGSLDELAQCLDSCTQLQSLIVLLLDGLALPEQDSDSRPFHPALTRLRRLGIRQLERKYGAPYIFDAILACLVGTPGQAIRDVQQLELIQSTSETNVSATRASLDRERAATTRHLRDITSAAQQTDLEVELRMAWAPYGQILGYNPIDCTLTVQTLDGSNRSRSILVHDTAHDKFFRAVWDSLSGCIVTVVDLKFCHLRDFLRAAPHGALDHIRQLTINFYAINTLDCDDIQDYCLPEEWIDGGEDPFGCPMVVAELGRDELPALPALEELVLATDQRILPWHLEFSVVDAVVGRVSHASSWPLKRLHLEDLVIASWSEDEVRLAYTFARHVTGIPDPEASWRRSGRSTSLQL